MNETRRLLDDTVTRLFAESLDAERLAAAERGVWFEALWNAVESTGLLRAHLDETAGGAGASWHEAFVIARACGRHAVPLPVVETMLAGYLAARAGFEVPPGPLGVAVVAADDAGAKASRLLHRVPWGRRVSHVVAAMPVAAGLHLALVPAAGAEVSRGHNVAREPRDTLALPANDVRWRATPLPADAVSLYGALLRSAQMAGALETILELSVGYANDRVQFGRPIGQFQAIQQELARLAGLVAAAGTAAECAARAASEARASAIGEVGATGDPAFEIACAKVVVGEAAEHGPRIAHQVHGAIGFTYEHRLHFFTRRLWAWRAEFGTPETWAERLGAVALAAGGPRLWPLVTAR
ncbi:MAG TPA: acyl-CoA dehydrogenase family protein [Candidatus Limnocylindria bacterium]|nr:acyl-CoA dehydrogenase family protein [Candidatus Limnocylindria bacterium]